MDQMTTQLFIGGVSCPANTGATYKIVNPARPSDVVGHAAGADIRYLGAIDDDADFEAGHFLRPSLVVNADPGLSVVRDEQFGPTLPVIAYDSEDEAISMANATEYRLSSSVWSADNARAVALATCLEAGFTNINSHGSTAMDGLSPFGGVKQTGIGRNLGFEGIRQFQELHSISGASGTIF